MPVALAAVLLCFGALLVVLAGKAPALSTVSWTEWRHAVAIFGVCAFAALALERLPDDGRPVAHVSPARS